MKNLLFIVVVGLLTLSVCVSCESETPIEATPEPSLVVLVKDESSSMQLSKQERHKQETYVKKYLSQHLQEETDVFLLSINSFSASRTNSEWFYYQAPRKNTPTRVQSKKQQELEATMYEGKIRRLLKKTRRNVMKALYAKTEASNQTAVIEVLPAISKISATKYGSVRILFLSDMVQESSFQDFTKGQWPMPSKGYAEQLAQEDFKRLKTEGHGMDLHKVESIQVLTPDTLDNEKFYVTMPYYWDELLKLGGFQGTINWEKL